MKRFVLLSIFALVSIVFLFSESVIATDNVRLWFHKETSSKDIYAYPDFSGDKTVLWEDAIKQYQIPEDKLSSMTTEDLIVACLDYPLFAGGIVFSNESMYAGFQETVKQFNGLCELLLRKDSGEKLIKLYINTDLKEILSSDPYPILRMKYLEYIIAQKIILNGVASEDLKKLCDFCSSRLQKESDSYNLFMPDSTLLILLRIYEIEDEYFNEKLKDHPRVLSFVDNGVFETITEDDTKAMMEYIKQRTGVK